MLLTVAWWFFCSLPVLDSLTLLPPVRVVIAGGGPAGLFAAQALLSRKRAETTYEVHLVEAKDDPRYAVPGPRAFSLGLNIRGQTAFRYFEDQQRSIGLWERVRKEGVECDTFFLHVGKQKFPIRRPAPKHRKDSDPLPPTLLIQRNRLCAAMVDYLDETYGVLGRFRSNYGCRIEGIDLSKHYVQLADGQKLEYDLLLGCDGVQSSVRRAIAADPFNTGFEEEEVVLPGKYKVLLEDCPKALESDAIHALENGAADFSLFCIPTPNPTCNDDHDPGYNPKGRMSTLVSWRRTELPRFLRSEVSLQVAAQEVADFYPQHGAPSMEALEALRTQVVSEVRTIRCNRYHHGRGRVLLMGDAAHSTGGSLGQGANSALQDVVALDQALDNCEDDLSRALVEYSAKQVKEGLALWQLLQLPPRGPLGWCYQIVQVGLGLLSKLRPLFLPRPTQELLSQSLTPFSQIARMVRLSCSSSTMHAYFKRFVIA